MQTNHFAKKVQPGRPKNIAPPEPTNFAAARRANFATGIRTFFDSKGSCRKITIFNTNNRHFALDMSVSLSYFANENPS